jgi:hypothetical protein
MPVLTQSGHSSGAFDGHDFLSGLSGWSGGRGVPNMPERSMKTRLATAGGVTLAIFIGCYFLSPFVFLRSLSEAARTGDRDTLAGDIDFVDVKDDLKRQLGSVIANRALGIRQRKHGPLADFALSVLPAVGSQVIDAVVTPGNVAVILRRPAKGSGDSAASPSLWRGHFSWTDLNHLEGRYASQRRPDEALTIILERQGVFGWKVVALRLPLNQLLSGS